ncbi:hypothetical protein RIF29_29586 [Crotalaria pallida]|uniref:Uncharacterized protein n=1 Tax=Crotalaria pallida TaxID=3830 RepID=A0AAN9I0I7_CROPI
MGRHWEPQIFGEWASSPMVVGSWFFLVDYGSPKSSVIQNPGRLFTPPSVSNLRTGSNILNSKGYNSAMFDNGADYGSPKSSVIQNPGRLFTPPSVSNLRTGSNILNSKGYNSTINGMMSVQVSQNRMVLSDITNISNSRGQCSINGSLLKKRKSNMFEVPIFVMDHTPAIDSAFSGRGNEKRKQRRLEHEVDIEFGAVTVQGSQNRNVLSDITNISHSRGQCLIVPISVMDDTTAIDFAFSERGKQKQKQRRLEHEVDIQIVPHITYLADNGVTCGSSNRNIKRRVSFSNDNRSAIPRINQITYNDLSSGPSGTSGTAGVPSTPRRRRVPQRNQSGGPVNINQHEDHEIWHFDQNEYKYDDCGDPDFLCRWCGSRFWLR